MIVLVTNNFFFSGEKLVGLKVANPNKRTMLYDVSTDVSFDFNQISIFIILF